MLKLLHVDMEAKVFAHGSLGRPFKMTTGVRQGSCEGPALWILWFNAILSVWSARCEAHELEPGVPWKFADDGQLRATASLRQCKGRESSVDTLLYADDAAILATSFDQLSAKLDILDHVISAFGGKINVSKTEWLEASRVAALGDPAPLPGAQVLKIGEQEVAKTAVFTYLGSVLGTDIRAGAVADAKRRCQFATAAFAQLRHVWRSSQLSRSTKVQVFRASVVPVLLFGSEHGTLDSSARRALRCCWHRLRRALAGVTWDRMRRERITTAEVLTCLRLPSIDVLRQQRLASWIGHVARMPSERFPRQFLFGVAPSRHGFVGNHTSLSYITEVRKTLIAMGVPMRSWTIEAADKEGWKRRVALLSSPGGPPQPAPVADPLACLPPLRLQCPVRRRPHTAREASPQHLFCATVALPALPTHFQKRCCSHKARHSLRR